MENEVLAFACDLFVRVYIHKSGFGEPMVSHFYFAFAEYAKLELDLDVFTRIPSNGYAIRETIGPIYSVDGIINYINEKLAALHTR
jgi:hypothetical protein